MIRRQCADADIAKDKSEEERNGEGRENKTRREGTPKHMLSFVCDSQHIPYTYTHTHTHTHTHYTYTYTYTYTLHIPA